jgi:hypothetical protein
MTNQPSNYARHFIKGEASGILCESDSASLAVALLRQLDSSHVPGTCADASAWTGSDGLTGCSVFIGRTGVS